MRLRFSVLSLMLACSPANPTPEVVKPVSLGGDAGVSTGPGFATPSKWSLTFSTRWREVASIDLDSGSKLAVGDGGERWIESVSGSREGAAILAPEHLVGVQHVENVYRFVGASGSVYIAHDPLGALTRGSAPVAGARQVAVGKNAIVVVTDRGDMQRTTDGGRTWTKVDAVKEGVVIDIAMVGDKGILVTAPQRFYGSKDDGLTWVVAKSPGIGVQSVVARDGALWVDGVEDKMRFDPAWGTFQQGSASQVRNFKVKLAATQTINRIEGRRAIQISGNGTERVWTLAIGDAGVLNKPRKVDELDGCEMVDAAIRGDDIAIACDARGSVTSGIEKDAAGPVQQHYAYGKTLNLVTDGGSLGWITRIVRSNDGGRTFREDTTVEGGLPQRGDVSIAIGAEDFVYLGRRCGPGYNTGCLPARVRASRSAGFSEVAGDDDNAQSGQARFATSGSQSAVYSVGMRDGEAFLFRWKSGNATPEAVGRIAASIDTQSATLTVDDDGSVRGFARSGKDALLFTYKEGGAVATTTLKIPITHAAFAGIHGYGVTNIAGVNDAKAYESTDGGKTWGPATSPSYVANIDACSSFGCVTDRGLRWGWDAPANATPDGGTDDAKEIKPQYARPLRCSAKDRWVDLGGGNLPDVSYVDHAANRWVLPTRDKDGKIAVLASKRGDPTTKTTPTQLLGAAPASTKFGSATTVHVQPEGVVALRYSYLRERKGPGRYNPVDAQMSWLRDATGKVSHASANKNAPFRVNKDPQGGYDRAAQPSYTELPEILSLTSKGVYFRGAAYADETDPNGEPKPIAIQLFHDDGKSEKIRVPEGDVSGSGMVATIDGTTELLAQNPESFAAMNLTDGKRNFYSVLGGLGSDDGVVELMNLGGKPALAATLRDPARAWLIGLKADPELGAFTSIATQKSLGDVPKACDGAIASDPNAYRVDAPYVWGSRRPVIIDSDGVSIIMATDRAEIRGSISSPDACVAAFDAMTPSQSDDDKDFGALVFTDDMAHSLLFRASTASWPATIAVRPMECQYQAGPLPEELETVEGFVSDSRHAAVAHKRY